MLAQAGRSTNIVFGALHREIGVEKIFIEHPAPRKQLVRRRIEKLGVRTVLGQLAFQAAVQPLLKRGSAARIREILQEGGLPEEPIPQHKRVAIASVNTDELRSELQRLRPKVVVINGTRIVSKRTLSSTDAFFLNMHAGITPNFRGVHGAYWALANRELDHCGVTIHVVDPGIDTGGIVAQARIEPQDQDNFATYPYLQIRAGLPLLVRAVKDAMNGTLETSSRPSSTSKLWYHPTLLEYVSNRLLRGIK